MNRLERLVADSLTDHAAQAPGGQGVVSSVVGPHPPRRGWLLPAGIAVGVLVVVASSVLAISGHRGASRPSSPPQFGLPAASGPATPPGQRWLSYHGVELLIPASWPLTSPCFPVADSYSLGDRTGEARPCPAQTRLVQQPPGVVVALVPLRSRAGAAAVAVATRPVSVDGHRVLSGTVALATSQTQPNTTRSALVIADATVAITVDYSGAGAAQASSILATLRVRPIDRSGCPALLPTDLATPVAGMRERFVPGTPLSGAVCRYDQGDLAGSVPLSGENLSTVRDALNAMPLGRPLHPTCAMGTLVAYTVRMVYPGGAAITVSVSGVGCSGFATNGAAQSQDLGSLPALLERLATSPS